MPPMLMKKWPPYVYEEFPKWVTPSDGKAVIVHDAEEEAAAMGTSPHGGVTLPTQHRPILTLPKK